MKNHLIFGVFLLLLPSVAFGASGADSLPTAGVVVAKMLACNAQRQTQLPGYRGMREYVLENQHWHKRAEMLVRVQGDADETKHFQVVSEMGWKAAQKHVLHKVLESEAEASSAAIRNETRLSPENYTFRMATTSMLNDRMTYVIQVVPKRRSAHLFEGEIWIDAQDYALERVEGQPAKSPSFWIRRVHFVHTYRKSGPFWFPASTESVTEARIFGVTSLKIRYYDYAPDSQVMPEMANVASEGGLTQ
jgi:hypothetical protein